MNHKDISDQAKWEIHIKIASDEFNEVEEGFLCPELILECGGAYADKYFQDK